VRIHVFNRDENCCRARLGRFQVYVGGAPNRTDVNGTRFEAPEAASGAKLDVAMATFLSHDNANGGAALCYDSFARDTSDLVDVSVECKARGRYVWVVGVGAARSLNLGEVQVFSETVKPWGRDEAKAALDGLLDDVECAVAMGGSAGFATQVDYRVGAASAPHGLLNVPYAATGNYKAEPWPRAVSQFLGLPVGCRAPSTNGGHGGMGGDHCLQRCAMGPPRLENYAHLPGFDETAVRALVADDAAAAVRLCLVYAVDFVCLGEALPEGCRGMF